MIWIVLANFFSLFLCNDSSAWQQLMKMMRFAETQENKDDFCIAWCADGRSFVIRDCDEFTRTVVPKYFKPTKFSSFTRKLYRWGFRQINRGLGPDDPVIFGCANFQRDAPEEMAQMRSVTAAATRKDVVLPLEAATTVGGMGGMHPMMMMQAQNQHAGTKRALEDSLYQEESLHKRLLLSKLLQQQTMMQHQHQQQQQRSNSMFGNMNPNSALAMASMQHHPNNGNYSHQGFHPHQQQFNGMDHHHQGSLKPSYYMNQMNQMNHQQPHQYGHQGPAASNGGFGGGNGAGEPGRTAEIVNAAIAALRNA